MEGDIGTDRWSPYLKLQNFANKVKSFTKLSSLWLPRKGNTILKQLDLVLNFIAPLPQFSCSSSDVSKDRCQIKIWNFYPIWVRLFMKLIFKVATILWESKFAEFVNLSRTEWNILPRNTEIREDKRLTKIKYLV